MNGTIRYLGFALIVAGALLLVSGTMGFSAVSADRSTTVAVADDPDAYLGLVDDSDTGPTVEPGDGATLFLLADNADEFDTDSADDLDAAFVAFNDGSDADYGLEASVEPSDGGDSDWEVRLDCGSDDELNGKATVTVEITARNGIAITGERTTGNEIEVACGG